jgi:aminoglycoside phosphotransferase (APT) family kinase protein
MTRSIANLKRYLEMVPELSSRMLISYKHLTQGITNESYHLKFTKDEYVIKFFNHEAIDLGIDHKKEMHIMSALESLDVAPVIIYIDLDEEFSIARWIEGDYWTLADYDDPLKVQQLIDRIKAIHALPCDDLPRVNLIQSIHAYRDKIAPDSDYSELLRDELLQRATATMTKTDQAMAHVLCHNDLLNSNILVNDEIHFFDWEFAGVNSPMFELAVICQGNQLNQAQQSLLLNGYFGAQWQDYQSLLTDWLWVYEYVALLWEIAVQKQDEESTSSQHERLAALLSG